MTPSTERLVATILIGQQIVGGKVIDLAAPFGIAPFERNQNASTELIASVQLIS